MGQTEETSKWGAQRKARGQPRNSENQSSKKAAPANYSNQNACLFLTVRSISREFEPQVIHFSTFQGICGDQRPDGLGNKLLMEWVYV